MRPLCARDLRPEDEICFHLFEGSSSEAIADVCRQAGLAFDRVSEAVEPGRVQ